MTRAILASLLLAACSGCGGAPGAGTAEPVAEGFGGGTPEAERAELPGVISLQTEPGVRYATRRAAFRWNTAMGCDGSACGFLVLDEGVSESGAVTVGYAESIVRPDGRAAAGESSRRSRYVRIARGTHDPERLLAHELGHILGAGHESSGVMVDSETTLNREQAVALEYYTISVDSLAAVCSTRVCREFRPEQPITVHDLR